MNKLAITIVLVLFANCAFAQTYYPNFGCFVTQGSAQCSNIENLPCSENISFNYSYFGNTVGGICERLVGYVSLLDTCIAQKNEFGTTLTQVAARFEDCRSKYDSLGNDNNKKKSLITRLRRACGSKCKKIK